MRRFVEHVTVVAVAALALLTGACGTDSSASREAPSSSASSTSSSSSISAAASRTPLPVGDDAIVTRVVDGDTIVVGVAGRDTTVRFIGIDTPETKDPRKPVQCFGREASARSAQLLPAGSKVRLAYDVERTDRYGRTLAYVYRREGDGSGAFINAVLVGEGYASVYTYPPNVAHANQFVALQREARDAERGLWGACPVTPEPTTAPGPPAAGGSGCDPSYPDACIPPSPPDLDCGDVTARGFRVLAPDPHRFDGNGDGIGCDGARTSESAGGAGRSPSGRGHTVGRPTGVVLVRVGLATAGFLVQRLVVPF